MMNPLVSIIIPCHNNANFIGSAIASSLNQTYPNLEVIVIDDGSSDNSVEIIRSFADSRLRWEPQANQGASTARNRGLELAQGSLIKFLDADDFLELDSLTKQVERSEKTKENEIVFGRTIWIDEKGRHLQYSLKHKAKHKHSLAHLINNCPLTSAPLHKRDHLVKAGGFNERLPRGQEHDLHVRLFLSGVIFTYHDDVIYYHRESEDDSRISKKVKQEDHTEVLQAIENQIKMAKLRYGELSSHQKAAFGQQLWKYGRLYLRAGYREEATFFFSEAKQVAGGRAVKGSLLYKILYLLFDEKINEIKT